MPKKFKKGDTVYIKKTIRETEKRWGAMSSMYKMCGTFQRIDSADHNSVSINHCYFHNDDLLDPKEMPKNKESQLFEFDPDSLEV